MAAMTATRKNATVKNHRLAVALLSFVAFTIGCDKTETTTQKLDKVQQKTAAAAQDMKDFTFAQKAQFVEKMESQLAEINRDLDQLAAKIEKSSNAAKAEAKPKFQALRDQSAALTRQLGEVKNATESTWDSVKTASQKAFDSFKDGFQQSRQWLSDKIAP